MPIISFIILVLGGLNWMAVGMLQYDFIAGFFGTQASIFSRLLYIVVGVATFYVIIDIIKNKGKLILFKRPKNNKPQEYSEQFAQANNKSQDHSEQFAQANNKPHAFENDRDILSD